ncbi:hypothetical protein BESB_021420 [Besnoitia besnoiti]|uniref:Exportin-5 C-terminal domain-containing protein n=1 Tax=Besnoitia besnoiti TaxID=94643 RepID=A0A2A9M7C5_BESBE|nr:hypothetical protein BESB_021420 [Besnoitia besnoiti]PFH32201.1 hypothetical protein BESB_021420 [Besnoitia besnoiti]
MEGADASLQQQTVNAVASSHDGEYSATEFLLSTTNSPAFEGIVQWLLTGNPGFPSLTLPQSRTFPLLIEGALERAKAQTADPSLVLLQYNQQKDDFFAAAQFVGFNVLLQGIQEKWEGGAWNENQKLSLKRSILSVIVGADLAPLAELPPQTILSGVHTPHIDSAKDGKSNAFALNTHASRMKCAQVLNAICQREWPQKWPGILPCLVVKATRVGAEPLSRQCSSVVAASAARQGDQDLERQNDEAFAAACVLLGLVRELSQEAKEETRASMPLKRRLQIAQGLEGAVEYLLKSLSVFLGAFQQHRHVSHLRTLIVEFLRELAGVVDVSLVLRYRDILLSLVKEGGQGGALEDCRPQILQTFDVLAGGLAKKRSKKPAIDSVPAEDLTSFIHCVIYLVASAMAHTANHQFEVDPEGFELDVTIAEMIKHLCEACADQLLRHLDPVTLSLLWHGAILPLMAHPSLKIATAGVAASTAIFKRFQFFSSTFPSAFRNKKEEEFLQLQCEALARELSPSASASIEALYRQSLEQFREKTFPVWFDLKSYLSLLFLRTLRVGDPALLAPLGVDATQGRDQAFSAPSRANSASFAASFSTLLDRLVVELLQTTEAPAALARAGCLLAVRRHAEGLQLVWNEAEAAGNKGKESWISPLLEPLAALLPVGRYPQAVKAWYWTVAELSGAEDDLGTDALQGFAARYASIKSSSLLPLGLSLSFTAYSARRVAEELTALAQVAVGHAFFHARGSLSDFLLVLKTQNRPMLPDKQQPWVCPAYLVLDAALSVFESCVQRLKSATLTYVAIQGAGASSATPSAAAVAVEWMLPAQAGDAPWEAQLASLFQAFLDLKLVDLDAILSGRLPADQQAAFVKQTSSPDVLGASQLALDGDGDADGKSTCLYDYLLEARRLEFIASCAFFLNYKHVKVPAVLDLLFRRILAEAPASTSSASACSGSGAYPLTAEQQVYLCRRRALYTLISMCTACPSVLKNYLQMMLQHVQGRLQAHQAQLQDTEKNLLVESLVSLISACQIYKLQQEHTLPLVRPYVQELLLLSQKLGSSKTAEAPPQTSDAESRKCDGEETPARAVGLLLFLLGDRRTPGAYKNPTEAADGGALLSGADEDVLTTQRRSLARVLSALESCIKRTTLPSDPAAARAGGYLVDVSPPLSSYASVQDCAQNSFSAAIKDLMQASAASQVAGAEGVSLLPKRHPLASLIRELAPVLFQLVEAFQQLWHPEVALRWPAYRAHFTLGEEEFLSLHGHTPLSFTPSALLEAVALTFPAPPAALASGATDAPSACGLLTTPADLTPLGSAYAKSSTRLIRRHLYHLRCLLYRLLGACCSVPDGFYVLPNLDDFLEKACFAPVAFLPLHQLEQQLRLFWMPLVDPLNLPPQPPYPAKQLVTLFLQRGVQGIVERLNREWERTSQMKLSLEAQSRERSRGKDEERDLNLYMLQVYAADSLADTLFSVLKTLLHLMRPQGSQTGSPSADVLGAADAVASASAALDRKGAAGADSEEDHAAAKKKHDEEAAAAAALNEMRRCIYTSGPVLAAVVTALLQAQRWPNPNTIMEAHNVLRTYVKTATKLFTPIPACTAEICALVLRGVMTSFFEKRPFDPLAFGEGSSGTGMSALQRAQTDLAGGDTREGLSSCTPMQEFLSAAPSRPGKSASDANKKTQVATYTATAYQVLKGMCRVLGERVSAVDGQKLQPSSLLMCPYTLGSFNFFRSAEVPVRLSDEEFERFVAAIMQNDSKEGKAFVKEFFERNWEFMQRAEGKCLAVQFKISELPDHPGASLAKLQSRGPCDLGSTFLSSVL